MGRPFCIGQPDYLSVDMIGFTSPYIDLVGALCYIEDVGYFVFIPKNLYLVVVIWGLS